MSESCSFVPTIAIKAAVDGHEAKILEALGISGWRTGKHIHCPYPNHPDKNESWRWAAHKKCAFCTCDDRADDIFKVVSKIEGIDFAAAKLRIAEILHRADLIKTKSDGCSLLALSAKKKLPVEFLQSLGVREIAGKFGKPVVEIPYFSERDGLLTTRTRINLGGRGHTLSAKGSRASLYGLDRLEMAIAAGYVVLVEGETDCWTLWLNDIPALGLPGGGVFKDERDASCFADIPTIYAVIEPDHVGAGLAEKLGRSSLADRVRLLRLPIKDPSELWIAGGANPAVFEAEFQAALSNAEPCPAGPPVRGNGLDHGPVASGEPRWIIRVLAGLRHQAADEGLAAMQAAGIPFYVRDRKIVQVCHTKARSSDGKIVDVPAIVPVELAILSRALGQSACWERVNTKGDAIRMDPPKEVVEQIAGMIEKWPFPPLAGVIGTPSLRPDGSLLATEGYDPQTGFVLLSPPIMPPIPERPSPADAENAIALLVELLTEFPFQNAASRSVAISMLMTPVVRAALSPAVPLHVVTAPESGTGKSYLLDIASAIALGDRCAVMALSKPEETEKRLIGAALAGHPIIALDNCSTLLLGDFLCQVTERPLLQLRPLGTSKDVRVANTFTVYADGNNLTVGADVVRRTLQCALDANMEEPSDRQFVNNPVDMILSRRGDYIAACLTIVRAYIAAGRPRRLPPVPSFKKWSDLVRSPLVWLGYPDPVETTKTVRNEDPIRQARAALFAAWATEIGCLHSYRTADLVALADNRPDWLEALLAIARASSGLARVDPAKLGHWLRDNANAIAGSFKLHVDRSDKQRPKWQLQPIKKG